MDFTCVEVGEGAGALDACVADDHFREQNGQVGSPCPGGGVDCFSELCLENPRGGLDFCSAVCGVDDPCPEDMLCVGVEIAGDPEPEVADVCVPAGLVRDGLTGDPCPIGGVDCVSHLCLQPVEGDSYCTTDCSADACLPGWACEDVADLRLCVAP